MFDLTSPPLPRLPWRRNLDGGQDAYEAYPFGDTLAPRATVDQGNGNAYLGWRWTVNWPGRFGKGDVAISKQAAADQATIAFWRCIDRTPGWICPPELRVPATIGALADFDDEALNALRERYLDALAYGNVPTIETAQHRDQMVYSAIFDEQDRRRAAAAPPKGRL